MKIDSVDFFYLSMPEVLDISDGSQDALMVRVRAGNFEGWGECEASPLTSIASWVCPRSHGGCKPVRDSVLGQTLESIEDINRIGNLVRANSLDLLQADHTLSGIDIALWDLMGRKLQSPVWELLGHQKSFPKTPYASQLFGDTPQETLQKARAVREQGYQASKFGWGSFGRGTVAEDRDQLAAAREGLGDDGILLVDAGTAWVDDAALAGLRIPALQEARAMWLEEPFVSGALDAYYRLAQDSGSVKLAGGEGCHNFFMAQQMIDHAALGFVQIDAGRIGGITPAKRVADYAAQSGVTFVNHSFTSHLALSASLQPYAGIKDDVICEYPVEPKSLAIEMTKNHLLLDDNGQVQAPDAIGLGVEPNLEAMNNYLVEAEIKVGGKVLYETPSLG